MKNFHYFMLWMCIFMNASGATVGDSVLVRNPNIYIALLSQVSPEVLDQIQSMVPHDVPEVAPEVAPVVAPVVAVAPTLMRRLIQAGAGGVLEAICGCMSGAVGGFLAAEALGIGSILPIIMNPNHADGNDVGIWEWHLNHKNVVMFQLTNGMFIGSIVGGVVGGVVGGAEAIAAALDIVAHDTMLPVAAGAAAGALSMFADILMRYGCITGIGTVSIIPATTITLAAARYIVVYCR